MADWFRLLSPTLVSLRIRTLLSAQRIVVVLLFAIGTVAAAAQTTTISGTVYDPRTTSNSLPLPNVLVYVTTDPVPRLPSGVQCLTYQAPSNAISYAYTTVDGAFMLDKVPLNTTYTLVIQAGKWRRQFALDVSASPIAGLSLHMPADHTQGDIPMIAIATGSVDAAECVLLDMGIAPSEFTDDNASVNAGGHIHLYTGSQSPGSEINASTPSQGSLMNSAATLNSYDMVMFPCQGTAIGQTTPAGATNLLNFANAGGRLFTTHYSFAWLVPDPPYNSQFPAVANWTTNAEKQVAAGVGTVEQNFSDGATLAQWLQNSNATEPGTSNQIDISNLRTDVSSVVPPTQSWVTLNNGDYGGISVTNSPVMQLTFNTPVGAPAANQCGRVMFNDYHVFNVNNSNAIFPAECPSPGNHVMSAQEKMLEYALFDLSTFVQPVVVPTINITFAPGPLVVKQNDSGGQVIVNVTNTSATTATSSSAVLTFALPQLFNITSITDATGGWSCNASTLTCTRASSLPAGSTDSVTLTFNVGSYPVGGLSSYTGQLTATVSSATFSTNVTASDAVIYQQPPPINWAAPKSIVFGTAVSALQLNATSSIPGTFTYSPAAGTVLTAGQHTLTATFIPADTTTYTPGTASVALNVLAATPSINLAISKNVTFLSSSLTLTAGVPISGTGGTVTFFDGSAPIGTAPLNNGSASVTTSSLITGTHSITATYSGDNNYGPATSSSISVVIQDFTLTVSSGGAATVMPTGQAGFTITVTPVGGSTLPGPVNLSLGTLPFGATAALSTTTIAASSPGTSLALQVNMAGSSALTQLQPPGGNRTWPLAIALLLLPFGFRKRGLRTWLMLAALSAFLAVGVTGCGGTLAPQSFSFPVNAVSGTLSHSVTVKITVQKAAQ